MSDSGMSQADEIAVVRDILRCRKDESLEERANDLMQAIAKQEYQFNVLLGILHKIGMRIPIIAWSMEKP